MPRSERWWNQAFYFKPGNDMSQRCGTAFRVATGAVYPDLQNAVGYRIPMANSISA